MEAFLYNSSGYLLENPPRFKLKLTSFVPCYFNIWKDIELQLLCLSLIFNLSVWKEINNDPPTCRAAIFKLIKYALKAKRTSPHSWNLVSSVIAPLRSVDSKKAKCNTNHERVSPIAATSGTAKPLWKWWSWQVTQNGGAKNTFFLTSSL